MDSWYTDVRILWINKRQLFTFYNAKDPRCDHITPVLRKLHSVWHAWFTSRCLRRRLSTWQMTAASCLTVLGALCGQLTSRLALYHENTAAMASELLQPLDLVCGIYWSNCTIRTSPTDCFDSSWRDTFLTFRSHQKIFIGRSWYSVLPSLDATISCRIKKAVVGVLTDNCPRLDS